METAQLKIDVRKMYLECQYNGLTTEKLENQITLWN